MSFVLSVSKMMKAGEVRALCMEARAQKELLAKQEVAVKRLFLNKEKAAS
jgi:hypothetical protein